jgi:arylsulfatase
VSDAGGIRDQYCHAIDVLPTILELCGLDLPETLNGIAQMSYDGASLAPVVVDATAPAEHRTQYYECWGSRAMYHDGWKAVTNHVNQLTAAERDQITGSHDFATDTWALFDTRSDPIEAHDRATDEPDRLADLVTRWFAAAERNQVFPLDDGAVNRIAHMHVPWTAFRTNFRYLPGDKVHEVAGPNIAGGFRMIATFANGIADAGTAVLCEQGDWISGWAWYLAGGEARWCIAGKGGAHTVAGAAPPDTRLLVADGALVDGALEVALSADGVEIARRNLGVPVPLAWAPDGAFLTVGYGRPFPVSDDYVPPATAPRSLVDVTMQVGPLPPFDLDAEMERIMRHQ